MPADTLATIVISGLALLVSALAVTFTVLHYRRTATLALHSNTMPVMSHVFTEFRSR